MLVLGIETSCDETAAAVVELSSSKTQIEKIQIKSDIVSSQVDVHKLYGGVVPELASREHLDNLPLVVEQALKQASLELSDLDGLGVTRGPGLKGCLLMGCEFAKALSFSHDIPLVGVNHIEGHLHAAFLNHSDLQYPFLSLVVSGGHTELVYVKGLGDYQILARTSDDAAGEAFDKSANLLGFEYPGGATLAKHADQFSALSKSREYEFTLPKVMRESPGFSFSGLKTAISLLVQREKKLLLSDPKVLDAICYAIQDSIVDALITKLSRAIKETGISQVVVTGGVAANHELRRRVSDIKGIKPFFPELRHCVDNAAMIALVAGLRLEAGERESLSMTAVSRWPVEELNRANP